MSVLYLKEQLGIRTKSSFKEQVLNFLVDMKLVVKITELMAKSGIIIFSVVIR